MWHYVVLGKRHWWFRGTSCLHLQVEGTGSKLMLKWSVLHGFQQGWPIRSKGWEREYCSGGVLRKTEISETRMAHLWATRMISSRPCSKC